jgi:hypothetical protein
VAVAKWAEILQIERTGYYAWLRNREAFENREAHLKKRVKEEFEKAEAHTGLTGSPQNCAKKASALDVRNVPSTWLT